MYSEYKALAESDELRRQTYREQLSSELDTKLSESLRASLHSGTPFGGDRFRNEIEKQLGRSVGYARRGRPRREAESAE